MCVTISFRFQLSYHKFNESQRAQVVLRKLQDGEIVALISDAGTPGISDPGMELVSKHILVSYLVGYSIHSSNCVQYPLIYALS